MSFKLANYSKSTPKKWQVIGDLALVLIPVLIGVAEASPMSPEGQSIVIFWMSSVLAVTKVVTQFFSAEK